MKRKKHSFALMEVIVSITIISIALSFFLNHIYRFANHEIHQIQKMDEFRIANNLSLEFEINLLPSLSWKDMKPAQEANWEDVHLVSKQHNIRCKIGYLPHYETKLADNTQYRLICYYLKFGSSDKAYKYYYILKKE